METSDALDAEPISVADTGVSADQTARWNAPRTWRWTPRGVVLIAAALIATQLLLRVWVVSKAFLYWDDFILAGRATKFPLVSADLLLYDHDGHFMPGAFFLTGLLTRWAPLEWWPMAITLIVLQALASLAVWRT